MPTFETLRRFERDWKHLTAQQQTTFRKVVTDAFVPDLTVLDRPFRPRLRVKGVTALPGVFEMTWDNDGRATFSYSEERAVGGHGSLVDVVRTVFANVVGSVHIGPAGRLLDREPVFTIRARLIWSAGPARAKDWTGATVTRTSEVMRLHRELDTSFLAVSGVYCRDGREHDAQSYRGGHSGSVGSHHPAAGGTGGCSADDDGAADRSRLGS